MANFLQKTLIILIVGFLFAGEVFAASLNFSPAQVSFHKDENFTVGVFVNAEVAVNAVQGVVVFPTDKLAVLSIDRERNSVVDLWVRNPSFSNGGDTGNVTFEGVILNPGYTGPKGHILNIVFRAKREGSATLSFTEFSILANDGQGTEIANGSGVASVKILPAKAVAPKPTSTAGKEAAGSPAQEVSPEVLAFFQILPGWVRWSFFLLLGAASLILALIILSFGLVVVVWILNHIWRQRGKFLSTVLGAKKEIESDISYAAKLLGQDLKEARDYPSFNKVAQDYWISLKKIVQRFFTKNT